MGIYYRVSDLVKAIKADTKQFSKPFTQKSLILRTSTVCYVNMTLFGELIDEESLEEISKITCTYYVNFNTPRIHERNYTNTTKMVLIDLYTILSLFHISFL